MATIKVEQGSINELKSAITFAAEQTSQAANMVSKAIDGMSGMSFSAKPGLESELTSLKNRLNQQARLSQSYCRAVQETVDALTQVDDSAGTSAEGVWHKATAISGAAVGSVIVGGGLSLAARNQMDKQSDLNGTFLEGTSGVGSTSTPNIIGGSAASSASQSTAHGNYTNTGTGQCPQYDVATYKLYQNEGDWVGTDADAYDGPAMISAHGCLITSISMLESLYQGRQITPPEAIKELNMQFSNGAGGNYGYLNHADHYSKLPEPFSLELLYQKLKKGPVIVGGSGPYGEHYMVVSGYKGDGTIFNLSDFLVENPDKWTQCQNLDQYGYKNLHSIWTRGE